MKYWIEAVRFTTVMTIITAIIILTSACQDSSSVQESLQEVSSPEESISFSNPDYDLAKAEREATPSASWILSGIDKEPVEVDVDACIQEVLDSTDLDGQEAMLQAEESCP